MASTSPYFPFQIIYVKLQIINKKQDECERLKLEHDKQWYLTSLWDRSQYLGICCIDNFTDQTKPCFLFSVKSNIPRTLAVQEKP